MGRAVDTGVAGKDGGNTMTIISAIRRVATAIRARLERKAEDRVIVTVSQSGGATGDPLEQRVRIGFVDCDKNMERMRAILDAFERGYEAGDGPKVPICNELPDAIRQKIIGNKDACYVGGWTEREEPRFDGVISVLAHDVGIEAARYLNGQEPYGVEKYRQGVLTEGGVDEDPVPDGYTPLYIQPIIKCMGAGGAYDPFDVTTTIGWKALCLKEAGGTE